MDDLTRRLAAIVVADIVGYSRLMEADESGTMIQLKAVREQLIDAKIAEHRGRIVKTTGDGMLAEFASVTDAVQSCVEIQRGNGRSWSMARSRSRCLSAMTRRPIGRPRRSPSPPRRPFERWPIGRSCSGSFGAIRAAPR